MCLSVSVSGCVCMCVYESLTAYRSQGVSICASMCLGARVCVSVCVSQCLRVSQCELVFVCQSV